MPTPVCLKLKIFCIVTVSPSMPVISWMLVSLRVPSDSRLACTTMPMVEATCARAALAGRSTPAIAITLSSRASASRTELAWIVVIEPS